MDVTETETGFAIRVDAPGIDEKDLEVRAAPRSLCITGKRQESSDQRKERPSIPNGAPNTSSVCSYRLRLIQILYTRP